MQQPKACLSIEQMTLGHLLVEFRFQKEHFLAYFTNFVLWKVKGGKHLIGHHHQIRKQTGGKLTHPRRQAVFTLSIKKLLLVYRQSTGTRSLWIMSVYIVIRCHLPHNEAGS